MRKRIRFNEGWHFSKDGKAWSLVTLPHTWNGLDGQDGRNDYYRGRCIYKKKFPAPEGKVFLKFGAVNQTAEIFLNGKRLGINRGGYSAFTIECLIWNFDNDLCALCLIRIF